MTTGTGRILLLGYGAIACEVERTLRTVPDVDVRVVMSRPGREQHVQHLFGSAVMVVSSLDEALNLADSVDVVADCAGHEALAACAPVFLEAGVDVISVSVGALSDDTLMATLTAAAAAGGSQLQLLSGAMGGLDAVTAASVGGLDRVLYRGRKPPAGWRGSAAEERFDLDAVGTQVTHFSGSAREAAARFPKNANVAAGVALAGLGLDATEVELMIDPDAERNVHELDVSGAFGRFQCRVEGRALPDNPRSSALAAWSMSRALQDRFAPVRMI